MSQQIMPNKIYRHVLKGFQFYHTVDGSGCTFNELVSFVFLKNERIYKPQIVAKWVKGVLEKFHGSGMLQDDQWGNFQLHTVLQQGPFDKDEDFMLNPEQGRYHVDNSSEETLSNVPHYLKVLRRKGTENILPKHRIHAPSFNLPNENSNTNMSLHKRSTEATEGDVLFVSKFDGHFDSYSSRNLPGSFCGFAVSASSEEE